MKLSQFRDYRPLQSPYWRLHTRAIQMGRFKMRTISLFIHQIPSLTSQRDSTSSQATTGDFKKTPVKLSQRFSLYFFISYSHLYFVGGGSDASQLDVDVLLLGVDLLKGCVLLSLCRCWLSIISIPIQHVPSSSATHISYYRMHNRVF